MIMTLTCAEVIEEAWRFEGVRRQAVDEGFFAASLPSVNNMIEGAIWGIIGISMAAPLGFVIALVKRKLIGSWWAFLLWALAMYCSMGAFGVIGIDYEDFNRPFPFWLIAGFTIAQVCLLGASGGAGWRLWQLRKSAKQAEP